jgi:hypothetical protein
MISNEKYRKVVETLIKQNGDCNEPIKISCSKCPFGRKLKDCSTYTQFVLVDARSYLAELDKAKENKEKEDGR